MGHRYTGRHRPVLLSQRISSPSDLFVAHRRYFLIKVIVVGVLLTLIFLHNRVFGRMIVRYVDQGETAKLQRLRQFTRWIAFSNLGLTVAVMLVSVRLSSRLLIPPRTLSRGFKVPVEGIIS